MLGLSTLSLADPPPPDWGGHGWGHYHGGPDRHQLPPPPPQHRWAYIDGRYVLVAVATGIIAQILFGGH